MNKTESLGEQAYRAIVNMTDEQAKDLVSAMEFGWERIKAGEPVEAVVAEWREAERCFGMTEQEEQAFVARLTLARKGDGRDD